MRTEDELNILIIEWLGFYQTEEERLDRLCDWWKIGSNPVQEHIHLSQLDFIHSLDALFKQTVPKCIQQFGKVEIHFEPGAYSSRSMVTCVADIGKGKARIHDVNPALALARALEKLIDKGG